MTKRWHSDARSRRSRRAMAVLLDLAGICPAEHLRPKTPVQTPYQPFLSKIDRKRQASAEFRRFGAS